MTCNHAASGCNYPEGDCNGDCLIADVERLIQDKREKLEGEMRMAPQNDPPPLPEPYHNIPGITHFCKDDAVFSADQMRAHAEQAIAHDRAKLLEGVGEPVAWAVSEKITDWRTDFSAYRTKTYTVPLITTDQAAAAVLREREKVLEEAARLCESIRSNWNYCSEAIRGLK